MVFAHVVRKDYIVLLVIILAAIFLRFYRIGELMPFIGDQGWFYLSARDILVDGKIPLVGIPSSRPWLHQGPWWTYVLAPILFFFKFNPISPAYFTIIFDILTTLFIYKVGRDLFNKNVAMIACFLYAFSPLVIMYARIPYHTSLIPFFVLLFIFSLYKWINGKANYFPIAILSLSFLYNFELAAVVLLFPFLLVLSYGLVRKKNWVKKLAKKKVIILSILSFIIPMFPILLHDFQNGFLQTAGFGVWILYKILLFVWFPGEGNSSISNFAMMEFIATFYQRMIFLPNILAGIVIIVTAFVILVSKLFYDYSRKYYNVGIFLLSLIFCTQLSALFFNKTPSDAYLPMFFPIVMLLVAGAIAEIARNKQMVIIAWSILLIVTGINMYTLISQDYLMNTYGVAPGFAIRDQAAKEIIQRSNGREFNLKGLGEGTEFPAYTMNYEYLVWLYGHPVDQSSNLTYFITDGKADVLITEAKK